MATTLHQKSKSKSKGKGKNKSTKRSSSANTNRIPWKKASLHTLLNRVQPHRELWDCTHEAFRKKDIKRVMWRHIAAELRSEFVELARAELSADDALSKFNILKAYFLRETKRVYESDLKQPRWEFYTACTYMMNQYNYLNKCTPDLLSVYAKDDEDLSNEIYTDVASDPLAFHSSVLPDNPVSPSSSNDLITGINIQPHSPTQSILSDASPPSKRYKENEVEEVEQEEEEETDEDKLVTHTGNYLKSYMNLLQGNERKIMAHRLIQVIKDHRLQFDHLA